MDNLGWRVEIFWQEWVAKRKAKACQMPLERPGNVGVFEKCEVLQSHMWGTFLLVDKFVSTNKGFRFLILRHTQVTGSTCWWVKTLQFPSISHPRLALPVGQDLNGGVEETK